MEINQEVVTNAGGILGAISVIVFGAQKAIKSWSADRGDIQKMGIETELFNRMSAEMKRLAETNQTQEKEIQELRDKFAKLLDEFTAFRVESAKRDTEIVSLRERLKKYEAI